MRTVTVFDVDVPTGVAFARSLGRAGVQTKVYSADRQAAGRYSRHARNVRPCPPVRRADEFVAWIADGLTEGWIDLIAPTSDYVSFAVGAVVEKIGIDAMTVGHPDPQASRTALFKERFYAAFNRLGFPTPETTAPATVDEALADAERMGYPVLLKPRCHAGIGTRRGVVIANAAALASAFHPWPLCSCNDTVLLHEPAIRMPLLQRYHELGTVDVISVSGYLAQDGSLVALNHCRKLSQSPPRLGVGTMFEQVGAQPFTDVAVDAVREVMGTGIFELEVLVDKATGAHYAVDLNPRGFGQMTLDMGRGNDLPMLWYNDVASASLPTRPALRRPPEIWHDTIGCYVEFAVRLALGPRRRAVARHAWDRLVRPSVGAMHEWGDPLPGVVFALDHLRHPRALVRPFITDNELRDRDVPPHVLEDPGHGGPE
jgi:predicted ATP-grasp superfamily ATP-dependent carboligase